MKKSIKLFCVLMSLTLICGVISVPQATYALETSDIPYSACAVSFSQASGIYPEAFELTLTTDLAEGAIYYTTDGSKPSPENASAVLYSAPIKILRTSKKSTYVSNIDVTAGTVVKAAAFGRETIVSADGTESEADVMTPTAVATFFIGNDFLSRYPGAKIISLSTAWENIDNSSSTSIWKNYDNSGVEWERRGFMEVFDTDGKSAVSQSVGIRINGGATRKYAQKSLRIYSRTNADYTEKGVPGTENYTLSNKNFKYDFFDGSVLDDSEKVLKKYKSVILRNGGNEWPGTYIRDRFVQSAVGMLDFDTQGYMPSVVFMNGEYIGAYGIRERLDDHYFERHHELGDNSDVAIVKISIVDPYKDVLELDEGSESDLAEFIGKVAWISDNDMTDSENYMMASEYFDMSNIIDYIAACAFINNSDWIRNNMLIWKNTNASGLSGNYDSRWRFAMKDTDLTLGTKTGDFKGDIYSERIFDTYGNSSDHVGTGYRLSRMFTSLFKNPSFREEYVRRYNDYLNTIFKYDVLTERLDKMYNAILPLRDEQRTLWSQSWSKTDLSPIKNAISSRIAESPNQLSTYFPEYAGDRIRVSINNPELSKGYLKVNTLDLCENNKWGIELPSDFSAEYYKDVPLKLEAVPESGYKLDHFVINGESVSPENGKNAISLDLSGHSELNISVVFAADESVIPTATPTAEPTAEPTATPTAEPTAAPTATPTAAPTAEPTATPTTTPQPENISINSDYVVFSAEAQNNNGTLALKLVQKEFKPFVMIVTKNGLPVFMKEYTAEENTYTTTIDYAPGYKILVWDNFSSISPVLEPIVTK